VIGLRRIIRQVEQYTVGRFSLIVEALARLRSRSCIIDGEAVACDERGIAAFDRIRYRRNDGCVFLYAFEAEEDGWR
jgi:ATP-dependent DNA ligase